MSIPIETYHELSTMGKAIDLDPHNRRIKVYKMPEAEMFPSAKKALEELAEQNDCDKIIFYSKEHEKKCLEQIQCGQEGKIDGFFQGEDAYIYSLFLNPIRNQSLAMEQEQKVMEIVKEDQKEVTEISLCSDFTMRSAQVQDAPRMARLYDEVFETYPTPINETDFIVEMMNSDVYFTIIEHDGELVSACSADVFPSFNAAEMTDCATLPEYRGNGLLSQQFLHLEKKMEKMGLQTLFSYSRAVSVGMNLINSRHGYSYGGRLIQNSNIAGQFEDMNIWVKNINSDS
jgi:putative beta-lysine N-acetyltransferase